MNSSALIFAACFLLYCNADKNNKSVKTKSYHQLITEDLMVNYDSINCPSSVDNTSGPVNVSIDPSLFQILEVSWKDPNLQWDPALYGGVDTIMVKRSTIWLPDIFILGQISVSAIPDKLSIAQVFSNGTVYYASDQVATVSCRFDIIDFPYDTQNCTVQYTSWMYTADHIALFHRPIYYPLLTYYIENDEWTLRSYNYRPENYAPNFTLMVSYDIKITRKPEYYITTFIWPIFIINCLSIIGIFSPFNGAGEREEKVTMGLTTLLTMAVILMIIAGDMPASANGVPLLGLFIMVEIGLSSLAAVFSVFVIYLHSNWMNGTPVPHWLLKFTCLATKKRNSFKVGKKSNIGNTSTQACQNEEQTERESKDVQTTEPYIHVSENNLESLREKWSKVASRIDLLLMVIFLIANIFVCVSLLAIGNSKLNN